MEKEIISEEIIKLINYIKDNEILGIEFERENIELNNSEITFYSCTLKQNIYLISKENKRYEFKFNLIGE